MANCAALASFSSDVAAGVSNMCLFVLFKYCAVFRLGIGTLLTLCCLCRILLSKLVGAKDNQREKLKLV